MVNSLGFDKEPKDTRVVVAMSGGVDSSVVAAMLKEQGYDVIGITLQLYDHGEAIKKKNSCCAGQDIHDAKNVSSLLDFPHYVLDYESRFKQDVIDSFADAYVKGLTPIPCVTCNQTVKFKDLLETAKDLGADCMATGHYIQRIKGELKNELHRGADVGKDQSYFLFSTTQEQLDYLRFPLGKMDKSETRKLAEKYGLSVADKPDSQDICFVPNGGYADLVQKLRPESVIPGEIIHVDGTVLGKHDGIINFTIGQRKGIGIGGRKDDTTPLYVVELRPDLHQVLVGGKEFLGKKTISLTNLNWIGDMQLSSTPQEVLIKIRNSMTPIEATICLNGDVCEVEFTNAEFGVSPGQACVFYEEDRMIGGGWIITKETTDNTLTVES